MRDSGTTPLRVVMLPPQPWLLSRLAYLPGQGADANELDRQFVRNGVAMEMIDPNPWPWNPFAGRHPLFMGIDPLRALRVLFRRRDADLVLACFESPTVVLLLLRRLFRFRPPIVIVDIGLGGEWPIRRRILNFVVPRLDGIIVLSENQVTYIHERWKTNARVVTVLQHVDVDFYTPEPTPDGGPILSVGDDVGRDFDTLIEAVAGSAQSFEVNLKTSRPLHALDALPEAGRGQFNVLRERLSSVAYRQLFVSASCVVLSIHHSLHSSGVGTLLEAMAMGKPIIVSDSPGIRDYIIPDETALVVPCGDAAALRDAIELLARDPALAQRLGAGARRFVERNNAFSVNARRMAEVLREIVADHANGGG